MGQLRTINPTMSFKLITENHWSSRITLLSNIITSWLSLTLSHRWCSLTSLLFLPLWPSLSCIGWMANVEDEIFLRGPKSTLWLEAFFQCPPLLILEWETFAKWGEACSLCCVMDRDLLGIHLIHCICRFRYHSCQYVRDIDNYFKLVRSTHRHSWPTIQLLQFRYSLFKLSTESFFAQLDQITLYHATHEL